MSTIINTGMTTTSLKGNFFAAFNAVATIYQQLTTRIKSTGASESYKWLGSVPQMREWGSGRLAKGLRTESYDIVNHKYEATIEVDRDELADDQLGQIIIRVRELAKRAASYPDSLLANLINNGHSSGYNSYDGVPFFSSNHVSGDSGAQGNIITLDATDHTDPTVDECKELLNKMIAQMLKLKDDQGEFMSLDTNGLILIVDPSYWGVWLTALKATIISSTTNVPVAVPTIYPFARLTDPYSVFLCKTDTEVRPFVFQDREPLEFNSLASGSEEEFKREKYLYGCRARYALAYGYWQYCIKGTFT